MYGGEKEKKSRDDDETGVTRPRRHLLGSDRRAAGTRSPSTDVHGIRMMPLYDWLITANGVYHHKINNNTHTKNEKKKKNNQ